MSLRRFIDRVALRLLPRGIRTAPPSVRLAAALEVLGGGGAVTPTHFRQADADEAEALVATNGAYYEDGTIIAVINPTAIGVTHGGLLHFRGASGFSVWLAIMPDSPDKLVANLNHSGSGRQVVVFYTPGDAALYDGTPKVVWMRWENGGTLTAGFGSPSGALKGSASAGVVADTTGIDVYLGTIVNNGGKSFGGDYEVAAFARVLSDAEIDGVISASTLASLAPGDAYLYPRPAEGQEVGATLTDPSTQVQDETAHNWSISTVDGTSAIQLVR